MGQKEMHFKMGKRSFANSRPTELFLPFSYPENKPFYLDLGSEFLIEYSVGVVTLIGDRMKYSSGVASMAIGAIPQINIKRGIFAPHTSQIILVVEENKVGETVAAISAKRHEMNKSKHLL